MDLYATLDWAVTLHAVTVYYTNLYIFYIEENVNLLCGNALYFIIFSV
jgi:hypothetical protein